jgi:hypothetical protein
MANLEVYFQWRSEFEPYREQYQKIPKKKEFKYYEIYNALKASLPYSRFELF